MHSAPRRAPPCARGSVYAIDIPAPTAATPEPEALPLRILYEDADLVVVDKPAGMVVHPAAGPRGGTLVNALLHHVNDLSGIGGELRPGIVHRLDRGTSGRDGRRQERRGAPGAVAPVSAIARSRRNTSRSSGAWCRPGRRIDAPIGRDPDDRQKMSTRARRARSAVTRVTWARHFEGVSLLQGRDRDRPHAPDPRAPERDRPSRSSATPLYGGVHRRVASDLRAVQRLERPFLHAARLAFTHPTDGRRDGVRLAAAARSAGDPGRYRRAGSDG